MNPIFSQIISKLTGVSEHQVSNTVALIDEGCTIPFISRYRKEATGALDEVQVAAINDALERLKDIESRKTTILKTIEEQGKLTDELRRRIEATWDSTELEDIYLPYKPKRRTRAEVARQKGLAPLATYLMFQKPDANIEKKAAEFVSEEKGVANVAEAIQGAQDIIAEQVSESEEARNAVRINFRRDGVITSRLAKGVKPKNADQLPGEAIPDATLSDKEKKAIERWQEAQKYRDYFDFSEPLSKCASHRLLAMRRGEAEGFLTVSISGDDERCLDKLDRIFLINSSRSAELVWDAVEDGFTRLLKPSIETEFANISKELADREAIRIFVKNLEQLLMSAPLGQKRVLALDPGFRTGCKVVCLDAEGNLLHNEAIYPHPPKNERLKAADRITTLVHQYRIQAISIGNGTASRETEEFVRSLGLPDSVQVFVVSEDGASIYSASKVAREEFPDHDVTVRGAVSIGRRLMDPLAELVKIDPNSIGVGQYQKDVDQKALKHSLDQTVEMCVNKVGVNLNTASRHLLTYVSGLGPALAQNIVNYRSEHGAFTSRRELLKVPKLGPKAYQQAAGFLRVAGSKQPLDNSAVHPESYPVVEQMARDLSCSVSDLLANPELRARIDIRRYVTDTIGIPTLQDIMNELDKPGRDPRQQLTTFAFSPDVKELADVRVGMTLPGIITNITNFGCFVDVGVHTKGLVHVSELSDHFVKDPASEVQLHQHVQVRVLDVDLRRGRLALSMKGLA